MSDAYVRLATREDCLFLATRLREEDLNDVRVGGKAPEDALLYSFESSNECYTACGPDDVPFAVFGIYDIQDDSDTPLKIGAIWLLGSDDIMKYARQFVDVSREWIEDFGSTRDMLFNYVHKHNRVHIRWLRRLGFCFVAEQTINNEPVYEFLRINTNV